MIDLEACICIEMSQDVGPITDTQGSIQMFVDFYWALGKRVTLRRWRDLPSRVAELDTVVISDGSLVLQREDAVQLIAGIRNKSRSRSGGGDGPGPVVEGDPRVLEEGIGRFQVQNSGQAELLGESSLPSLPKALHASSGLRRVCRDKLNV